MKQNINSFGEEFKKEIDEIVIEESRVRSLKEKYETELSELIAKNKTRKELLNKIRINKINEINAEINDKILELEILEKELEKENKDKHIIEDFLNADFPMIPFGIIEDFFKADFPVSPFGHDKKSYVENEQNRYKCIIENINSIESKKKSINEYINYLMSLKENICKLFGHDVKVIKQDMFQCKCCNKYLIYDEYILAYNNAIYKGVVPYYYDNYYDNEFILSKNKQIYKDNLDL